MDSHKAVEPMVIIPFKYWCDKYNKRYNFYWCNNLDYLCKALKKQALSRTWATEFYYRLLLLRKKSWYSKHRENQLPGRAAHRYSLQWQFHIPTMTAFLHSHDGRKGTPLFYALYYAVERHFQGAEYNFPYTPAVFVSARPLKSTGKGILLRNRLPKKWRLVLWRFSKCNIYLRYVASHLIRLSNVGKTYVRKSNAIK